MLERELAGGGPLINLGVHFIDLFCFLAQEEIVSVSAVSSSEINGLSIEDVISMRMVTKQNRICTIECGYIFPSDKKIQREFSFSISSPDAYYTSGDDQIIARSKSADGQIEMRNNPGAPRNRCVLSAFCSPRSRRSPGGFGACRWASRCLACSQDRGGSLPLCLGPGHACAIERFGMRELAEALVKARRHAWTADPRNLRSCPASSRAMPFKISFRACSAPGSLDGRSPGRPTAR